MDFKTLPSRELHGGTQHVVMFPNGYGASIVQHEFSYGGDQGLWELAVLNGIEGTFPNEDFACNLCYTTPITNDVLGYLSEEEVNTTLQAIEKL